MIFNSAAKTIRFLKTWKIFLGRDPQYLPSGSIVFFPVLANVMFCGFAGVITIKNQTKENNSTSTPGGNIVQKLSNIILDIQANNIQSIFSSSVPSDQGSQTSLPVHSLLNNLTEMGKLVDQLKVDCHFEDLFFKREKTRQLADLAAGMKDFLTDEETFLLINASHFSTSELEVINSRLIRLKDIQWSLEKDILANITPIAMLSGIKDVNEISSVALKKYRKINFLLNSLDRIEVRGRDSAGIQMNFTLGDMASMNQILSILKERGLYEEFLERSQPGDLINGSIALSTIQPATHNEHNGEIFLSFTYKTSSIIGELGRNVRELRRSISEDNIFHEFARQDVTFETSLAHTRWASVGSITIENCHPVNNFTVFLKKETDRSSTLKDYPHYGQGNWFISVALNGDIDNYQNLRRVLESDRDLIAPEITTDTKIIPLQIERYLIQGLDLEEAFRSAVADFEGSHAIAMVSNLEPGKAFLALRGSGQSIYIGIGSDQYIFSSELYGLVEGTSFFLKMDGDKPSQPGHLDSTGQIFIIDQQSQGNLSGVKAFYYDGAPIILDKADIQRAEITTRDIDRGDFPHYFLKEITESTRSVSKTLLGKYRISTSEQEVRKVTFNLGEDILPSKLKDALAGDEIRQIFVIGHGTAAVAGIAVADALNRYLKETSIKIEAKIASELSGFALKDNLKDTLVIPITQSGTTTDTNRAVAMAAERGAWIISIVNRRQSDITTKSHGVFYTSDGRDIEMSVASTKAFYSQIVAGYVLALYIAHIRKTLSDEKIAKELESLERASDMMKEVLEERDQIRHSVEKLAIQKKYWAVVGSGPNKAAAEEIRIKLSELCYKTISADVVENKKHIDLSAEPLIIVCAAGNPEPVVSDIVKDVAIFKAHKAIVVVFADKGEKRFNEIADAVIEIPRAPMPLPVILNTLAGHLWGYYAACLIDAEAQFFREFKHKLNTKMVVERKRLHSLYEMIVDRDFRRMIRDFSTQFNERRNAGSFSFTNVKTISDLTLLLKYAVGKLPLEDFWQDFKGEDEMLSPIDLMDLTLGHAVDELSRPIDAIRHQAKTVTVGTSRKEPPLQGILFDFVKSLEISAKSLTSNNIIAINRLQKAIEDIRGYTLYSIGNLDADGNPGDQTSVTVEKRWGVSLTMRSRVETSAILMGTKKTIVRTGQLYVGQGKSDGAPIVIIPIFGKNSGIEFLLLIHVVFNETLTLKEKIDILGDRFYDIRNLINEYNLPWDDQYLEDIPTGTLLGEAVEIIAGKIKHRLHPQSQYPAA
jgi:glucosamine--fructose-6-phosphate aminotransferase (isomerizing)